MTLTTGSGVTDRVGKVRGQPTWSSASSLHIGMTFYIENNLHAPKTVKFKKKLAKL